MPRKGGDRTRTVRSIRRQRFSSTRKSRSIRPYPRTAKEIERVKRNAQKKATRREEINRRHASRLQGMDQNNAPLETASEIKERLKRTKKSNTELEEAFGRM